ncbi:MAG: hypothetical protein HOV71_16060 [Hamadaea sp.]|nr:hypothetical protein [Hamadaea sp.]NUT08261.1 hypothetical protein [Hamadaea sp.]
MGESPGGRRRVGLHPQLAVTSAGKSTVDGWTIRFTFSGDQNIRETRMGRFTQTGAVVGTANESHNVRAQPGATTYVRCNATTNRTYARNRAGDTRQPTLHSERTPRRRRRPRTAGRFGSVSSPRGGQACGSGG